ncbi:MAG: hypothetical protein D6685_05745 [Bacteroidetes bacterium]|nr:hypothetical protein AWN76_008295 [Rhodothermaceae bacterium RA]RMH65677.1 MAG: hypothetical protein D6685_05745 [Bacteroidota bacterium]
MHTFLAPRGLRLVAGLALAVVLSSCSGAWLNVRRIPEDGYVRTFNYQFQAQVHADDAGVCKHMVVRVKPLNKMYSEGEPPSRLQLFDDDCLSPFRFERAEYYSREGMPVRLFGTEVVRFLNEFQHLESELVGWLWREGVI